MQSLRRALSQLITARRNVQTMATPTPTPPAQPLLVILGSTGTGKSELAVELATRFRGEIINADAMQMYGGLPIITNKISVPEQRGVPHHLLGHIPLSRPPWDVDEYTRHARRTIREIRERGNVPIIVGGTQYYVDPLIFPEVTLAEKYTNEPMTFPILEESTEVILAELRKVDPVMASQWHPKDRRKIQRSLEIYLRSGKPASEFYAEQAERKAALAREMAEITPWENLLFWVYSEREVLKTRLDNRIDKMLEAGLLDEVREVLSFKQGQEAAGSEVNTSKGIWQSIGYKQFEPYFHALDQGKDPEEVQKLKDTGLEEMKAATRRYANYQNRWTRLKQFPLLAEQGPQALDSLYLLDSTDVSAYHSTVVEPAAAITAHFLAGQARQHPTELSDLAREILGKAREPPPETTPCEKRCDICGTEIRTEQMWGKHIKSATHRRAMKKKNRLALVPVESPAEKAEGGPAEEAEEVSSPDLGAIFS